MVSPNILVRPAFVQGPTPWVGSVHQVRPRQEPQRLSVRERILELGWIGRLERDRSLVLTEVEQAVSERKVEQLALPACHPVGRTEGTCVRLSRRSGQVLRQIQCVFDGDRGSW